MVMEVQKEENIKGEFSIERFESAMAKSNTSWAEIESELGYDAKPYLTNRHKPAPINIIGKACTIMGIDSTDYVMMKSDTLKFNNNKIVEERVEANKKYINTSIIDTELLALQIDESDWGYESIASLMSSKSILLKGVEYIKRVGTFSKENLNILCWALRCKQSDICDVSTHGGEFIPDRVINRRQKYILNSDFINNLQRVDINSICKHANIPLWFIYEKNIHVSAELLIILRDAIAKVTDKLMSFSELCINYDNSIIDTVIVKDTTKTQEKMPDEKISKEKETKMNTTGTQSATKNSGNTKVEENMKKTSTTTTNNYSKPNKQQYNFEPNSGSFMSDVFYKIDRMSDDEFDKLQEYVEAHKKLREIKKSLLN